MTNTTSATSTSNEKPKRLYPPTQLIVALEPRVLKVYMWILGWSGQGSVTFYPKQFVKATKLTEDEVERCIQTLEDIKLIDIGVIDQTFIITVNAEQHKKYYQIPMAKVLEGDGIKIADKVTWNIAEQKQPTAAQNIENMDDKQIQSMIYRLQATLDERQQMEKFVKVTSTPTEKFDDLPF